MKKEEVQEQSLEADAGMNDERRRSTVIYRNRLSAVTHADRKIKGQGLGL